MSTTVAPVVPAGTENEFRLTAAVFSLDGAVDHLVMGLEDAHVAARANRMARGSSAEESKENLLEPHAVQNYLGTLLEDLFSVNDGGEDLAELAEAAVDHLHRLGHVLAAAAQARDK